MKDRNKIPEVLHEITMRNDLVITLGAGNICETAQVFLEELKERMPLKLVSKG